MDERNLYLILQPESRTSGARPFRGVHHALVLLGIAIMLASTVEGLRDEWELALDVGFWLVAGFFVFEYVLRLIASAAAPGAEHIGAWRARLRWVASPSGIYDLVCALAGLAALSQQHAVSLLASLWIFKLVRYSAGLASLRRVISRARSALMSVLLGFMIVLLVAGSLAYLLEREANPKDFGSIPAALWWAIVTLTTTGYGDVVPQTGAGRLLAGCVMISGILVFALWAGILATGYAEETRRREFLRTWELVANVPFFHSIGASLIAEVARLLRPHDHPSGSVIMRRGERGDCMYFIADGEVEIQLSNPVTLGAGHFFGELALLTRAPRNATVVTVRPSTLLTLDIADFHELLGHQPELARAIREEAVRRVGTPVQSAADALPETALSDRPA